MPRRARFHICLTADDTGLLKRVDVEKAATTQIWGVQAAGGGIVERVRRAPGGATGVGLQDGTVRFWDAAGSGAAPLCEFTAHASAGLGTAGSACAAPTARRRRAWWRARAGCVRVWPWRPGGGDGDGDRRRAAPPRSAAAEPAHSFHGGRRIGVIRGSCAAGRRRCRSWRRAAAASTWRCGAWRRGSRRGARATCRTTSSSVVPVAVADARWLPGTPQTLVVGTGFVEERLRGEVRLYDVRAQRHPHAPTHAPAGEEARERRRVHRRRPPRRRRLGERHARPPRRPRRDARGGAVQGRRRIDPRGGGGGRRRRVRRPRPDAPRVRRRRRRAAQARLPEAAAHRPVVGRRRRRRGRRRGRGRGRGGGRRGDAEHAAAGGRGGARRRTAHRRASCWSEGRRTRLTAAASSTTTTTTRDRDHDDGASAAATRRGEKA